MVNRENTVCSKRTKKRRKKLSIFNVPIQKYFVILLMSSLLDTTQALLQQLLGFLLVRTDEVVDASVRLEELVGHEGQLALVALEHLGVLPGGRGHLGLEPLVDLVLTFQRLGVFCLSVTRIKIS